MFKGQFHETMLSKNSLEIKQNSLPERKTRRNFQLKFREIYSGWNFMLNISLMKFAPGDIVLMNPDVDLVTTASHA